MPWVVLKGIENVTSEISNAPKTFIMEFVKSVVERDHVNGPRLIGEGENQMLLFIDTLMAKYNTIDRLFVSGVH